MSGTSLDGVDVALIETDGETHRPVRADRRIALSARTNGPCCAQALAEAAQLERSRPRAPVALAQAEALGYRRACRRGRGVSRRQRHRRATTIDVIGFHGQTVLHRPERQLTVQIGDGRALAALRHSGGVRFAARPMSRPAGRARRWCRCFIARWCAHARTGRCRSPCSISAASPTSPIAAARIPSPAIPAPAMR